MNSLGLINFIMTYGVRIAFGFFRSLILSQLGEEHVPYTFDTGTPPGQVYDYVIVGAGVGGSVVASRLSETGASVLLLEAGKDAPPESAVPAMDPLLMYRTDDWKFKTNPGKETLLGYSDTSKGIRVGKSVGGTTIMNGLHYTRGNKKDMDNWARLGNLGWDFQSVLPYFLKTEDFEGSLTLEAAQYHNRGGPLSVKKKTPPEKILPTFISAGIELGFREIDPSFPQQLGFTASYLTVKDGLKATASESFLRPVIDRPNLTVVPRATVRRVLFNRKRRASGVEYIYNNKLRVVHCRREVILSAGALNTPKILMLSGIGPKQHLKEMKIKPVADVEGVGKNLQNHPLVMLPFAVKTGSLTPILQYYTIDNLKQYLRTREGMLGDMWGGEGYAFLSLGSESANWPDVLISATSGSFAGLPPAVIEMSSGLRQEIIESFYPTINGSETMSLNTFIARPQSRGSVTLQSNNVMDPAVVYDEPCTHPDDMELLLKAIKASFQIINTAVMKDVMGTKFVSKPIQDCRHHLFESDNYWRCHIRYAVLSGYHYVGTTKMAPDSDPMGVVSPRLKVRGVSGLRVIDGSIMPEIVGPNPMATIYMIGEKGADMIKQDWGYL